MANRIKPLIKEDKPIGLAKEKSYPIFCFKHLQSPRKNKKRDNKLFFQLIERLQKLSELGWEEINKSDKHGYGTEKLPTAQIKPSLPTFVSPDVKELVVFRANGANKPFLGIRNKNIFHILFIEENFGDVYDH